MEEVLIYIVSLVFIFYGVYNLYYEQSVIYRGYLPIILGVLATISVLLQEKFEIDSSMKYEKVSLNKIKQLVEE